MKMIIGKVVLVKKNKLDINDLSSSALDRLHELVGKNVTLQLISSSHKHQSTERNLRGKVGKQAMLEDWITTVTPLTNDESSYKVSFEWEEDTEMFLDMDMFILCVTRGFTLLNATKRTVFSSHNKAYLPFETPEFLRSYRDEELEILRGDGSGMLQEWDRVYDYALYNDLGNPDKDLDDARPVLGGSSEYPYPRRGRTGRPPTKSDPRTESRLPLVMGLNTYVPRDERFGRIKFSDFLAYALKVIIHFLFTEFQALFDNTHAEFDTFEDFFKLYEGGFKLPDGPLLEQIQNNIPLEMQKILLERDSDELAKFPTPQVIKEDKSAWTTDEEFGREMLAGVNPIKICLLKEFPPKSKLDINVYGNQDSSIKPHHIEKNLNGLQINEALKANRMFILDHHDSLMPHVRRINTTTNKIYASRTLLLLQNDGTLKPLAIELSLPHPDGDKHGAISNVYTPAENGIEGSVWQLAKAYVAINDSGIHQLISHWLNTHAVIEPFVIAANRQLSVMHPVYKLLYPHFRYTMYINAIARQILINGGGILEATAFPGKYSMEMSSMFYKDWVFPEQALPVDLLNRGIAVVDTGCRHGLRLLIDDYPYAVDGLEIWSAIKSWVEDYCKFYYKNDDIIQNDTELQSWWKELREEGHGDKKHEPWWPKMDSCQELINICTTFIWVASALHASVNFGQYPYTGYLPNRPSLSRRFMPKPNTLEYEELKENREKVFFKTITPHLQSLLGIALVELLSTHSSDEIYLGQRECSEWTLDEEPLKAFEKFGKKMKEIEDKIEKMNKDKRLKNRVGPVNVPFTLLYPTGEEGLKGKGIPNSTSI
ncbi:unnamed protein product [Lactuca saligna]|uniref:Lipoxygenase n=1 Tax=Lactuca saligna TaxID=75948 RepID=A0AA36EN15_LACSI|nr:unnamed protein product [Lactuca saligna]